MRGFGALVSAATSGSAFLFRPLFASFAGVGAQNEADAAQAAGTGLPAGSHPCGGQSEVRRGEAGRAAAAGRAGDAAAVGRRAAARRCWWAGSTHAGRGSASWRSSSCGCASAFRTCSWCWCRAISSAAGKWGANWKRGASSLFIATRSPLTRSLQPGEVDCLLVNTTGELKYFYEHATVIFVGKSLTARGRAEPDRAGGAGQADGVRAEHAELSRRSRAAFVARGRRRAGAGRGRTGDEPWPSCWRMQPGASNWGATR